MITIDWHLKDGWARPQLPPFEELKMHPFSSSLHYAIQCFEGMKGYPTKDGKGINLFRAMNNMERMRISFKYLNFPDFDGEEYLKCIKKLVDLDREWMPKVDNRHSLYIRPTGISMEDTIGVSPANKVKLYTIMSPVGPYYPQGFKPVKVFCKLDAVRAWPNGSGDKKLGSNYGPTVYHATQVAKEGYD